MKAHQSWKCYFFSPPPCPCALWCHSLLQQNREWHLIPWHVTFFMAAGGVKTFICSLNRNQFNQSIFFQVKPSSSPFYMSPAMLLTELQIIRISFQKRSLRSFVNICLSSFWGKSVWNRRSFWHFHSNQGIEIDNESHPLSLTELTGFTLKAILSRKSVRELDLFLCAFNYTRLAGLQSPESRVKHSSRQGGRGKKQEAGGSPAHLRVHSAATFTSATGGSCEFHSILSDKPVRDCVQVSSTSLSTIQKPLYSILNPLMSYDDRRLGAFYDHSSVCALCSESVTFFFQ